MENLSISEIQKKIDAIIIPPPPIYNIQETQMLCGGFTRLVYDWRDDNEVIVVSYYYGLHYSPNFFIATPEQIDTPYQAGWRLHEICQILNG